MNLDDQQLPGALALLGEDSDPAAVIAATVRARLARRDRRRRRAVVGSLAAAVVATITVAWAVGAPGRGDRAPIGAAPNSPSPASTAATPPASSGAAASPSVGADTATTPDGERINAVFISCYATADVSNPDFRNYLGVTMGGGSGTAAEAIGSCTRIWAEGTLSSRPPYVRDQPSIPADPVPELTACTRAIPATPGEPDVPTQEIVVVPGDPGVCQQLGLGVPDA